MFILQSWPFQQSNIIAIIGIKSLFASESLYSFNLIAGHFIIPCKFTKVETGCALWCRHQKYITLIIRVTLQLLIFFFIVSLSLFPVLYLLPKGLKTDIVLSSCTNQYGYYFLLYLFFNLFYRFHPKKQQRGWWKSCGSLNLPYS